MAKKHVAVSLRKPPSPEKLDAFVSAAAEAVPESGTVTVTAAGSVAETASAPVAEAASAPVAETAPASAPASASAPAPEEATPAAPGVAPAPAASVEPPVVDAAGRALRPVTVYLPQPLAERLALHCITHDRDASNVIGEALEQHLSRRLGAGSWSAPGAASGADAPSGAGAEGAGPFGWEDPRRWADAFAGTRVERLIQVGRVIFGFWQRRPWAA